MIISCYSLTNASDEKDLDTINNELSSLVCSIPKHNILIIGDMNAQIGKNENIKFSLYNSNRNEEFLTVFSLENGHTLTQIMLKHK